MRDLLRPSESNWRGSFERISTERRFKRVRIESPPIERLDEDRYPVEGWELDTYIDGEKVDREKFSSLTLELKAGSSEAKAEVVENEWDMYAPESTCNPLSNASQHPDKARRLPLSVQLLQKEDADPNDVNEGYDCLLYLDGNLLHAASVKIVSERHKPVRVIVEFRPESLQVDVNANCSLGVIPAPSEVGAA